MIKIAPSHAVRVLVSFFISVVFFAASFFSFVTPVSALIFPKTGTLSVATDVSSPAYALVAGGSKNVTVGAFKFTAKGEAVNLYKLLVIGSVTSYGVERVSVYDGATKVGEGYLAGGAIGSVLFTQTVTVPKDGSKVLTVKADFSPIAIGQPVTRSGDFVQLNYGNAWGNGAVTGATISPPVDASAKVAGVRVMKSFPIVADDALPATGVADGRLMRFKIAANNSGSVSLTQLSFIISPSTFAIGGGVKNVNVYAFDDANYSSPISGVTLGGALRATNECPTGCTANTVANITVTTASGIPSSIQIPAGQVRYFEVRGSVTGATTTSSVMTKLVGDSGFAGMVSATSLVGKDAYFVWSPNSTTTTSRDAQDWTTGDAIPGLPASGLIFTRTAAAPAPTCALAASEPGLLGRVKLYWTTTNATNFSIDYDGVPLTPVAAGSKLYLVSETTYFTGTATGPGGTAFCSVFVPFTPGNKGAITR